MAGHNQQSMRRSFDKDTGQSQPLLSVSDLWVSFPLPGGRRLRAVRGVDLSVNHGETVGLVGESGCGKSTLAHAIMLLHRPERGRIHLEGEDLTLLPERRLRSRRRRFQMIFQDPRSSFNPRRTIGQSIAEPMEVFRLVSDRRALEERTTELLELVGLDPQVAGRYPHELSGGQRQRAAVARSLATGPSLLVADEPTSALDVSIQAQVVNLLAELQSKQNLGLLFISHDLQLVRTICHRTAVMYLGKIVELGPTSDVYRTPVHPYTQTLLEALPSVQGKRRRSLLTGDVPSPVDLPSGCPFRPRCPWAGRSSRCEEQEPEPRPVAPGRWVACHLADGRTDPEDERARRKDMETTDHEPGKSS